MKKSKAQEIAKIVNKLLGEDTLKLGSDPDLIVEFQSTGVLPIDVLLEGGLPKGRYTEIFGDQSTLKSYIGLKTIASVQEAGKLAALVDTEHAFDPYWATEVGVDTQELIVLHPDTGEDAVDASEALLRQQVDLLVWDSVAATLPKAEAEKMAKEKQQQARQAAFMSAAMRKLTAANKKTAILCINQTRQNVGQFMGDPTTVPGGRSLPFYASYRISLRKAGKVTEPDQAWDGTKWKNINKQTGVIIRAFVEKSKLNKPFREIYFTWDLVNGEIDDIGFLISYGLEAGIIEREGQTWKCQGFKTSVRGQQAFRNYVIANPKVQAKLKRSALGEI